MSFSDGELYRYARQIVLPELGGAGQAKLARARVAVVGAGGIGSPAIQYLAAAGVGRLLLIDDDRVELSNLQRQTIFATADADTGIDKVAAAAAAVARLNPHVSVEARRVRLDPGNAASLLAGADAIVDGSDGFATRLAVSDASLDLRVPLISASVAQLEGQLAVYRGWEGGQPCYRCLVGDPADEPGRSCAEAGVLGAVAGVLGSLAAVEAIRAVAPFGADPVGRLLLVDAAAFRFRTIALRKDPICPCHREDRAR